MRSLTVVPTVLRNGQRSINLRIESGNIRSKTIDVPYDIVTTSQRLYVPPTVVSATEKLQQMQQAKERWEQQRQRILTLPFRQAGHWMGVGFRGFQRMVDNDGWIYLRVKGYRGRWKLHEKPAWALRNGRHVDEVTRRA